MCPSVGSWIYNKIYCDVITSFHISERAAIITEIQFSCFRSYFALVTNVYRTIYFFETFLFSSSYYLYNIHLPFVCTDRMLLLMLMRFSLISLYICILNLSFFLMYSDLTTLGTLARFDLSIVDLILITDWWSSSQYLAMLTSKINMWTSVCLKTEMHAYTHPWKWKSVMSSHHQLFFM